MGFLTHGLLLAATKADDDAKRSPPVMMVSFPFMTCVCVFRVDVVICYYGRKIQEGYSVSFCFYELWTISLYKIQRVLQMQNNGAKTTVKYSIPNCKLLMEFLAYIYLSGNCLTL